MKRSSAPSSPPSAGSIFTLVRGEERDIRILSQLQALTETMTETEIIAREEAIPAWRADKDYTSWPLCAPVRDGGQVWLLLQGHNAAHYPGRPGDLRALWGLAHTTDPARAKPWVAPYGTSGLYRAGECCIWEGRIWRNLHEGNAYPPQTRGAEDRWEEVL